MPSTLDLASVFSKSRSPRLNGTGTGTDEHRAARLHKKPSTTIRYQSVAPASYEPPQFDRIAHLAALSRAATQDRLNEQVVQPRSPRLNVTVDVPSIPRAYARATVTSFSSTSTVGKPPVIPVIPVIPRRTASAPTRDAVLPLVTTMEVPQPSRPQLAPTRSVSSSSKKLQKKSTGTFFSAKGKRRLQELIWKSPKPENQALPRRGQGENERGESSSPWFSDEDVKVAMDKLHNPAAIIKPSDALELSPRNVYLRLTSCDALRILQPLYPPAFLATTVRRKVIRAAFGGSFGIFPEILPKSEALRGFGNFAFLSLEAQRHAPQLPGAPGLFFDVDGTKMPYEVECRVMVRTSPDKWLYVGQYTFVRTGTMSGEEWNAQNSVARLSWAREISEGKKRYRVIRARIKLRYEFGREPTAGEVRAKEDEDREDPIEVKVRDALRDLGEGKETMHIWAMKCVGYDYAFQKRLVKLAGEQKA
ncbi:hypothetical protein CONPUDRAFT_163116 [Coniophora puteana RWD-64-598 SS2]|uniref:DUF6697 domain-containing protein n=1 Tax=Coniophora puteana (strain RWD-64-598) TaxID=741705 RepID=A0A5M3MYZ6_CONPW|nr:uncharacterized protein CONPUDRAFT_163116 [Coniophora puteana RWD-64-598 SS2]EIW83821.1 hypothetical protein CONPUDRAFT_163116 [Coniophora puteana RWD-64-598 SS2]